MSDIDSVLVVGATGNQGGAVVDHLLASDHAFDVRGLTRDATTDRARALADRGVTVVEGDLYEPETLRQPVAAADGLFAVTNFWTEGYEGQVEQGENLAAVAAEEGVEHLVFSGVGSQGEDTGIPHFDSGHEIAETVRDHDLPHTVLGPVFFYENLEGFREDILKGTLAFPLAEGVGLQMVGVDDLGHAAATVFEAPDRFAGETVDLAAEELTLAETADVLSAVTGVDVSPVHVPTDEASDSFGEEFAVMCEWFNEVGYSADIAGLPDRFGFEFVSLEAYLRANSWAEAEEMASVPGWVKAMQ